MGHKLTNNVRIICHLFSCDEINLRRKVLSGAIKVLHCYSSVFIEYFSFYYKKQYIKWKFISFLLSLQVENWFLPHRNNK